MEDIFQKFREQFPGRTDLKLPPPVFAKDCRFIQIDPGTCQGDLAVFHVIRRNKSFYIVPDLFLYDIKQLDEEEHLASVGIPNGIILDNLRMLTERGFRVRVRVPLIPGFNDDPEQLGRIGGLLASLPSLDGVSLLPYHSSAEEKYRRFGMRYPMIKTAGTSGMSAEALASQLEELGMDVKIGA